MFIRSKFGYLLHKFIFNQSCLRNIELIFNLTKIDNQPSSSMTSLSSIYLVGETLV